MYVLMSISIAWRQTDTTNAIPNDTNKSNVLSKLDLLRTRLEDAIHDVGTHRSTSTEDC